MVDARTVQRVFESRYSTSDFIGLLGGRSKEVIREQQGRDDSRWTNGTNECDTKRHKLPVYVSFGRVRWCDAAVVG